MRFKRSLPDAWIVFGPLTKEIILRVDDKEVGLLQKALKKNNAVLEETVMELKRALWSTGVYTKPTPRDIWYVSTEHTEADIDQTLERTAEAVGLVRF